MVAFITVPSICPDAPSIGEFTRLSVKFLPDCEIVKPAPSLVNSDFSQGKAANLAASI
jgi:hypothetical protein